MYGGGGVVMGGRNLWYPLSSEKVKMETLQERIKWKN
jgi:hypothetical protein